MRSAIFSLVGLIALAALSVQAEAFPAVASQTDIRASSYFVEIAQGCGPGFHWVGRHRNRYGAWVPGRCARNQPAVIAKHTPPRLRGEDPLGGASPAEA
jgi:hypothetical protein